MQWGAADSQLTSVDEKVDGLIDRMGGVVWTAVAFHRPSLWTAVAVQTQWGAADAFCEIHERCGTSINFRANLGARSPSLRTAVAVLRFGRQWQWRWH